jgi:hypothetical protein
MSTCNRVQQDFLAQLYRLRSLQRDLRAARKSCWQSTAYFILAAVCLALVFTMPEEIKELVASLSSKQTDLGMGIDIRVAAAARLAEIGPSTKEFGSVQALEKLTTHKNPKVAQAARDAVAKINAS